MNTQILLAMLTLTAWFGSDALSRPWHSAPKLRLAALPVAIPVPVSGAIAALGDTLFPAASVASGMRQVFRKPPAHCCACARCTLRWRSWAQPPAGSGLESHVLQLHTSGPEGHCPRGVGAPATRRGALNIVLLAPVWMQILHLLLAVADTPFPRLPLQASAA